MLLMVFLVHLLVPQVVVVLHKVLHLLVPVLVEMLHLVLVVVEVVVGIVFMVVVDVVLPVVELVVLVVLVGLGLVVEVLLRGRVVDVTVLVFINTSAYIGLKKLHFYQSIFWKKFAFQIWFLHLKNKATHYKMVKVGGKVLSLHNIFAVYRDFLGNISLDTKQFPKTFRKQ